MCAGFVQSKMWSLQPGARANTGGTSGAAAAGGGGTKGTAGGCHTG